MILDGIGSTECLHIFIGNRLDDYRPGTSGKPVPGYEAQDRRRATASRWRRARAARSGSARVGRQVLLEQAGEDAPRPWSTAGSNTGDTYRQDEDGYFVYEGRSDDMLKVGGIWCSPVEIESCLIAHPAVLEAAVVGQADDERADQAQGVSWC